MKTAEKATVNNMNIFKTLFSYYIFFLVIFEETKQKYWRIACDSFNDGKSINCICLGGAPWQD